MLAGGIIMAKIRSTFTIDEELIKKLESLSDKTMVNKSRLVSEAISKYVDEQTSKSKGQG